MHTTKDQFSDSTDRSCYQTINKCVMDKNKVGSTNQRIVNINHGQLTKFCLNEISTAKYNYLTFLPKFLFEQFRRYANIFFLIISILQQFPNVSPTGKYTTAVPLVIILTISAIKEIIEDYKRHKADDYTNNSKILIMRNSEWVEICWKQLQVGDLVKLISGQRVPADLVLLSSSEPHGMSYIETSNLDGETNLKMRQGIPRTSNILTIRDLESLKGNISCEIPNRHLYEFCGNISLIGEDKYSLNNSQLILRGSVLKNTKWLFGIVVYSGHETKVMLNSTAPPLKRSSVERKANGFILGLCGLLMALTLSTTIASIMWNKKNKDIAWYLGFDRQPITPKDQFYNFLTFLILYNTIIPISLPVTMEVVRTFQAFFMNWDIEMYDPSTNTPANARTSNLNEDLGQVKYIFSDKTGTLTRNIMEFKKCSIAGIIYGESDDDFNSDQKNKDLLQQIENSNPDVDLFFKALSICHTVIPEKDDNEEIIYQASSPDESALVKAAKEMGYVFTTRTPDGINVLIKNENYEYKVLNVIDFTSARKRMSVIVQTPDLKIVLFTKGADDVIFKRLSDSSKNSKDTLDHLEKFANIGLRTLCISYAEINSEYYDEWKQIFYNASIALENRDEKIAEAGELIEKNLLLIGVTAIEDKLQDQVPETIANLSAAGIKIWVLTGDKQETAINIGYSCRLLTQSMELHFLDSDSLDDTRAKINIIIQTLGENLGKENNIGLIVNGETLNFALNLQCRDDFLQVTLSCKAIICCRVSPLQKAEIVSLVKSNIKNAVTLAIGDGANDVGMIQAAHVGIGISGLEGQQAACNSDYSISQFRFLNRLLLVHGAWNYCRLTKLILYSFYKNVCFFVIQFWFAWFSGFSGQIVFDRWSISFYNVFFTAAPPLALGLFDRSCSAERLLKVPELYKEMLDNSNFTTKVFLTWVLNSLYHSLILFFGTTLVNNHDIPFSNGQTGSLLFIGNCIFTYVIVTVCLKAGLEHFAWTWLSHLAIWGSIVFWFIYFIVYCHLFQLFGISADMNLMYQAVFSSGLFWLGLLLIPIAALTGDISWKAIQMTLSESSRKRKMEQRNQDRRKIIPQDVEVRKSVRTIRRLFLIKPEKKPDTEGEVRNKRNSNSEVLISSDDKFSPVKNIIADQEDVEIAISDFIDSMESDFYANGILKLVSRWRKCVESDGSFAFSQEENGILSQSELIRQYNSNVKKPEGNY